MTVHWGMPLYVHPAADPATWEWVGHTLKAPDFVVVNVSNGPGAPDDPYYGAALEALRACEVVGYVDAAYGRRPARAIREDAAAWRERYGVTAVMLDQLPSAPVWERTVRAIVEALRADAVSQLVANPGAPLPEGLAAHFDLSAVFEGAWAEYARAPWPPHPASERLPTWHLVHDCPPAEQARALALAEQRGARFVFATERHLPNPYDAIPAALRLRYAGPD